MIKHLSYTDVHSVLTVLLVRAVGCKINIYTKTNQTTQS